MTWSRREQLTFCGIGVTLAAIVLVGWFVVQLQQGVRDVGGFFVEFVSNPITVCLYLFLMVTVFVCWDKILPWIPWLVSDARLAVTFDANDPICNDPDFLRHVYRIRVCASLDATTISDIRVVVTGIRSIHGPLAMPSSRGFMDKLLQPLNHKGPAFDMHSGVSEPVSVVRSFARDDQPGWIYLCDCGTTDKKDTGKDIGIEAGRYIVTIKASGRNCQAAEKEFFVKLVGGQFEFSEFDRNKDYSSVPQFHEFLNSMIESAKSHGSELEGGGYWESRVCMSLQDMLVAERLNACLFHFQEKAREVDGDDARDALNRGIECLESFKWIVDDKMLR